MRFSLLCLLLTSLAFSSDIEIKSNTNENLQNRKTILSNFNFNYFTKYTGKSLSGRYNSGATFNRFSGGQNSDGKDYDSTGSYELYQSFRLGYRFENNWNLSFTKTFQENLTDDVEYKTTWGSEDTRSNGRSYNPPRISFHIPSIKNFDFGWLSFATYYEFATAAGRANGQKYGYGIGTTLGIYSYIPGLIHGININLEKTKFSRTYTNWQGIKVPVSNEQHTRFLLNPYLNYSFNDRFTAKFSFDLDWDQKGNNVTNNMHDVGFIGLGTKLIKNVFLDIFVAYSITKFESKNTSTGASLDISI